MSKKIELSETKIMLIDVLLGSALRAFIGEYKKIVEASEEELETIKEDIDKRFTEAIGKIKAH